MTERPRFFDDLAGVAGGAFSALAGLRDEAETLMRARVEDVIRKLDLVKREDLEAVQEMAANARAGQEAAQARIASLETRLAKLEAGAASMPHPEQPPAAPGVSEADPASIPHPGDISADGPEAPPATMPPGSGAPGSSSSPTGVA